MPGASSGRCLSCNLTSANFNYNCDKDAFSIELIEGCLQVLKEKRASGLKTKNIKGVTEAMLLPISSLSKILVPTLHCPMGLIDKFLESFLGWAHMDVIQLTKEEDKIRDEYFMAEQHLGIAIDLRCAISRGVAAVVVTSLSFCPNFVSDLSLRSYSQPNIIANSLIITTISLLASL
jgi:hypothetical protein